MTNVSVKNTPFSDLSPPPHPTPQTHNIHVLRAHPSKIDPFHFPFHRQHHVFVQLSELPGVYFSEWRSGHTLHTLTSDVIDDFKSSLHTLKTIT